ncbi:MAG TPA: DUF3604 domain-containing protein [Myxococcales bacterium]|nr:DUF3604 domain-containing protein [Myxococcales bacterium]
MNRLSNPGMAVVWAASMTLILTMGACGDSEPAAKPADPSPAAEAPVPEKAVVEHPEKYSETREACDDYTPLRQPLFGDTHVHTSFSFDAAANTTGSTPVDANRFARGESIAFWPMGEDGKPAGTFKIDRPLDFLAVTDHGEFLGERSLCREVNSPRYDSDFCKGTRVSERQSMMMFAAVITTEDPARVPEVCGEDGQLCRDFAKAPWQKIIEASEEAYDRSSTCEFTSFIAYEYTGTPGTSNYHRNVIFRNNNVPDLPVSYIDAPLDSKLWARLDEVCTDEAGCDYITIPHNSNLANGRMGPYMKLEPTKANRIAYAEKRQQREPIIEIFQHKGASECVNGLSMILGPPDELCDVEAVRVMGRNETFATRERVGNKIVLGETSRVTDECGDGTGDSGMLGAGCIDETDFVRSGLLVGLNEENDIGINPMKLGIIAATDTHAATPGSVSESDWRGAVSGESTPLERLQPGLLTSGIKGNPGGLAGVWAEENSRDSIFDAMKRREVFGTSGPRIVPRFFGGWNYPDDLCDDPHRVEQAYRDGVPMGGDFEQAPIDTAPVFLAFASRDPGEGSRPLQQMQLIKGWVDAEGKMYNEVMPIAGTPNNGADVDSTSAESRGDGHDTLCRVYRDASFDPALAAYYYLRVVENPTARWSVHDCMRIPEADRPAVCSDGSYPSTIQEMAWTSPIWYRPN